MNLARALSLSLDLDSDGGCWFRAHRCCFLHRLQSAFQRQLLFVDGAWDTSILRRTRGFVKYAQCLSYGGLRLIGR